MDRIKSVSSTSIKNLRLSQKFPLAICAAALVASLAVGLTSYFKAASGIGEEAESKMIAVREGRAAELSRYLESIRQDARLLAQNETVKSALRDFSYAWTELGSDPTGTLQQLYIDNNPNPSGQKENLDRAPDNSIYSNVHGRYHPWFRNFLRGRGYNDVFLFDSDGNLVYSVFKEIDYATNLMTGQWKDTDLGNAFRAARANPRSGKENFFDFRPYAPSNDTPAAFISTPILDNNGNFAGALVFQMPIANMNAIMQLSAGMGETGDSFIVGNDFLMRSQTRLSEENSILARKVETDAVKAALAGKSGVIYNTDDTGEIEVSAYQPLEYLGTRWAVITRMAEAEVMAGINDLRNVSIIFTLATLLVVSAIGYFFARGIVRPITAMTLSMSNLAAGDTAVDIPGLGRRDEIGGMADAVQVFKENAIAKVKMEAEQKAEAEAKERRSEAMAMAIAEFEQVIGAVVEAVASAATEMELTAQAMSATAEETNRQSTTVAAAAEEASVNVQTVASAAEELSSSIEEVGRQVTQSSKVSSAAVAEAEATNTSVKSLAVAAEKIGAVVSLIQDIAEQTNLLALNATIEAARAGEAGKGFAVVASEVKSLANQTAKATEEIGGQIAAIQGSTTEAVTAIGDISKIIGELDEIAASISAAVEEQGAATQEIARNVQQAAEGTGDVSSNIGGIAQAAGETGAASTQVLTAAQGLAKQSVELRTEIEKFLTQVRAA